MRRSFGMRSRFFFSNPATIRSTAAVKSVEVHAVGAAPGRQQRRLVDEIGEVRAGEAGGQCSDLLRIDVGSQHRLFQMHVQDRDPILLVGAIDQDLAVETAGAQQRGIQYLRPVGRGQQDDARRRIEAIQLHQQLVQRLLLLVVAAKGISAAGAAQGVQFVDEDDRRRLLSAPARTGRAPGRRRRRRTSRRTRSLKSRRT